MNESIVAKRILDLMESTHYDIIQTNGQRLYGPPPDWPADQMPPKNSEVFVGRLPRDCFEDELVPIFAKIGPIYQFRLMIDFSGNNRGFAFVTYTNTSDARRAVIKLNNYKIRAIHRIGVVESINNCRLFIGNLPPNLTEEYVFEVMSRLTTGVVSAVLYYKTNKRVKNYSESRGFAFIEYESHRDAAMARRKLLPERNQRLFGTVVSIDWAIPEPNGDKNVMSAVTVLFVRYLNYEASEEMIRYFFSFDNQLDVIRVKRIKNYAFVHYKYRKAAEAALHLISVMNMRDCPLSERGGHPLEVKWSIPPGTVKKDDQLLKDCGLPLNGSLNPMASPFEPSLPSVLENKKRLFSLKSKDLSVFCGNRKNME